MLEKSYVYNKTFTATPTGGSALVGDWERNYLKIQNLGNQEVLIAFGTPVTDSNGTKLGVGFNWELPVAPISEVFVKSADATENSTVSLAFGIRNIERSQEVIT